MHKIYIFTLLLFMPCLTWVNTLQAQTANYNNLDSLNYIYENANNDSARIHVLYKIAWAYMYNNSDSALIIGHKALKLAEHVAYKQGIADSYYALGYAHFLKGDYLPALSYFLQCQQISDEIDYKVGAMVAYNGLGGVYNEQFEFNKAHNAFTQSLAIAQEIDHKSFIGYLDINLGEIHYNMKEYETAVANFQEAKTVLENLGDAYGYITCYTSLSESYFQLNKLDSAMKYVQLSHVLSDEINNMELRSRNYLVLARIYARENKLEKSSEYGNRALHLAQELNSLKLVKSSSLFLYELYYDKQLYENALENYITHTAANDSMFSARKKNEVNRLVHKAEIDAKEKEFLLMQKDKKIAQMQAMVLSGAFLLVFVLGILIHRSRKKEIKSKLELLDKNKIIEEKNYQLGQTNEEILTQRDEIEIQRDFALKQKKEITDSIDYAKLIQHAVLPEESEIRATLPEHFIFFKPRDIVSGDFYWYKQIQNHVVIVAADCTGHGVPGAFMSMLGISFLNEIVSKFSFDSAGELLNKLRKKVKKSLKQRGEIGESKDGMDIALCIINLDTHKMQYAGAYNPLYIVRKSEGQLELMEIKANRQPIGIHLKEDSFKTHDIQLQKDDVFYIFSDGFMDQFGGAGNEKFTSKRFKKLLLSNHDKPMLQQHQELELTFGNWTNHTDINGHKQEQLDDILVIGVKI